MARVLLIEDDPDLRDAFARMLRAGQHEVTTAENGRVGVETFDRVGAEVVVTDILMPEMEGIETIRALLKRSAGLPIVAMSGATFAAGHLVSAAKLGARRVLRKPFSRDALLDAVDRAHGAEPGEALQGRQEARHQES